MSAAGTDSPVSRKRPLGPAHASPAAWSGGGEVGASGSPKAKRRLFAAGPGNRSTVAAAAAAAEVDWLRRRRQLILLAGAMASVALSYVNTVMWRRRKHGTQQYARLHDSIVGLATAVRTATAPVKPHPDLYPTVMSVPGFTEEQLLAVLFYLKEGRPRGAIFLAMSEPHRVLWIEQILAKQEL